MHIYIVFSKNLRQCFYTYQLVQIFIEGNTTDVSSKLWKKNVLIFYIHCLKLEESQSHHFPIHS